MKITSFYPALITKNAEQVIEKQKKFGFRIIHQRKDIISQGEIEYVLENPDGQRMDVVYNANMEDMYVIRVNVDDYDEAVRLYQEDGFRIFKGPAILPDSKNAILTSPGGQQILIMQHLKKS